MNDGGGQIIKDIAGVSNGTGINNPISYPGKYGNTFQFNGTSQCVQLPFSITKALDGGTQVTLSTWFKGSTIQSVIRMQPDSGQYAILGYAGNSVLTSFDGSLNFVRSPNDDVWHHVLWTWKANTTNGFQTYIDGVLDSQKNSANVTMSLGITGTNPGFGAYDCGGSVQAEYVNGSVFGIRIYNRALSAQEVRQLYVQPFAGFAQPARRAYSIAASRGLFMPPNLSGLGSGGSFFSDMLGG